MKILGIVLAGGKSSRFGDDKALALVNGIPMIQWAVQLLTELHFDPCIITHKSRDYSFLKCRIENDFIPDKGPLGGLYTAFSVFDKSPLIVLTCDMPLVASETLCALTRAYTASHEATLYQGGNGKPEPFPGIYEASLKSAVQSCIDSNKLSMRTFIESIHRKKILSPPSDPDMLMNINSEEDFQRLSFPVKK